MDENIPTISISYDKTSYDNNVAIKGTVSISCSMEILQDQFEDISFRRFVESRIQDAIIYQMRKAPICMDIRRTGTKKMVDGIVFNCDEDIPEDKIRTYIKRAKDILGHEHNIDMINAEVYEKDIILTSFVVNKKTIRLIRDDGDEE